MNVHGLCLEISACVILFFVVVVCLVFVCLVFAGVHKLCRLDMDPHNTGLCVGLQ